MVSSNPIIHLGPTPAKTNGCPLKRSQNLEGKAKVFQSHQFSGVFAVSFGESTYIYSIYIIYIYIFFVFLYLEQVLTAGFPCQVSCLNLKGLHLNPSAFIVFGTLRVRVRLGHN